MRLELGKVVLISDGIHVYGITVVDRVAFLDG